MLVAAAQVHVSPLRLREDQGQQAIAGFCVRTSLQ